MIIPRSYILATGFGPKPNYFTKKGSWLQLPMWLVC